MIGLVLIALGTGGIKPCVAAFGGDQFILPEEEKRLQGFFSIFYFAINTGGLAGMLATPTLRKAVTCFGQDTCYSLGFGFPAILMLLSLSILFLSFLYYVVIYGIFSCILYGEELLHNQKTKREYYVSIC